MAVKLQTAVDCTTRKYFSRNICVKMLENRLQSLRTNFFTYTWNFIESADGPMKNLQWESDGKFQSNKNFS